MTTEQFDLSKERCNNEGRTTWHYHEEDVKEFIRRLKEEINIIFYNCKDELSMTSLIIDRLAGKELIEDKNETK